MKKNKRAIFLTAIFLFFTGFGLVWGGESERLKPAPELKLTDLDGNTFTLSDYRGKVVILNFWAVGCPPCRVEIPHLVSLKEHYGDKGLVIFGIAIASGNDKTIRAKGKEWGVNYPIINGDKSESIQKNFWKVRAVPTSYVINQERKIFKTYVGFSTTTITELKKDIKILLQQ